MSLDLFERESIERLGGMTPQVYPDVGVWDGFMRGAGLATMRGLAKAGRAIDLAGAVGPVVKDAISGGTELQDRYFREHDEVWGAAVDYWTPTPREVGAAGDIAGTLLSVLPLVLASPGLAVGAGTMSGAEDLMKKGVDWKPALGVGLVQGAGLGLGIYMPILGQTFMQRVLLGGIGFNTMQGFAMRAASEGILQGTPGEGEFRTFDPEAITLDVLLGAAFGSIVHLSPRQRAEGAQMWERLIDWGKGVKASDAEALAVLRQAQHRNVDSLPGRPAEPVDVERHAKRVMIALEQLVRDEPVNVTDLPEAHFDFDPERVRDMASRARELTRIAEGLRKEEGLSPVPPRLDIPEFPDLTPEQRSVERRARAQVLGDVDGQIKAYEALAESEGGKIISVDTARELFPDYVANRQIHSPSVHEPGSALMKELYERKLAEPDPNGLNMVTFTAGGTGAGKTSALNAVPLASKIVEASQIIYDTNLATFRSGVKKIDQALRAGKQVNILFVGTDPVEAFKRALKRAMRMGRTVPIPVHAETHRGSAATMEAMMQHYQGNDRVQFVFLDNGTGGKGDVNIIEPAQAREWLRSINFDNLEPRLQEALDAELKAGRISEAVYRGTTLTSPEGARGADRPGGEGEPRAGEEARVGDPAGRSPQEVADGAGATPAPIPTEAPAANRGTAEPPPPRGRAGGEAAGVEAPRPRPPGIDGRQGTAITERGTEIKVTFRVVEAPSLITSHDDQLRPRSDYPAEVQPRERGRAASEAQIAAIEGNIRPELLGENPKASDGAPIVGPDGVVESGNARTIALRRAYLSGRADKYKAWLIRHAAEFGLKPEDVEKMGWPMLVRERVTDVDRAGFAREANEQAVAAMGPAEVARADAARMPELDRLVTAEDGTINVRASMNFVRDFMESVPANERPALMTATGELSQAGLARIRNAIFQRAYGDSELVAMMAESTDANIKNVLAALLRAAPEVAKLNELVAAGARYETTLPADLAKAARLYSQLRAEGMPVKTYLSQGTMFDTGPSREVQGLLLMLDQNSRAPNRLADAIQQYVDVAHGRGNPRQAGLFGEEEAPTSLRLDDQAAQAIWLTKRAKEAGFADADDMAAKDIKAFMKLAEEWRGAHPMSDEGKVEGAENDPLRLEAERFAAQNQNLLIKVGEDTNGSPILKTVREYLDEVTAASKSAREDLPLFEAAAQCLLGGR